MKELTEQLIKTSREMNKAAGLLLKHDHIDWANRLVWAAKVLDGWVTKICKEGKDA